MIQIHQIKKVLSSKGKKRVGRGGKRGTYSGKGMKGQKARAGHKMRPEMRDIIKKIPKQRGYKFKALSANTVVVNLDILQKISNENEKITPEFLLEKGAIQKGKGKIPEIKILGRGRLSKKIIVSKINVSEKAAQKIKQAGGSVEK